MRVPCSRDAWRSHDADDSRHGSDRRSPDSRDIRLHGRGERGGRRDDPDRGVGDDHDGCCWRLDDLQTTGPPPLREARLVGSFSVRTRILSKDGYGTYVAPIFGWRFRPVCRENACDVRWRDLHDRSIHGKLSRHGARYRGSYAGYFYMECSGARVTSSLWIRLKVVKARMLAGDWRATRLVGTVHQREETQLSCHASEARLALRARLRE